MPLFWTTRKQKKPCLPTKTIRFQTQRSPLSAANKACLQQKVGVFCAHSVCTGNALRHNHLIVNAILKCRNFRVFQHKRWFSARHRHSRQLGIVKIAKKATVFCHLTTTLRLFTTYTPFANPAMASAVGTLPAKRRTMRPSVETTVVRLLAGAALQAVLLMPVE